MILKTNAEKGAKFAAHTAIEADRFNHSRTSPESSYQPSAISRFLSALGMTSAL
jgi:hypothetical protein